MLKERAKLFNTLMAAVDMLTLGLSFALAYWVCSRQGELHDLSHYTGILLIAIPSWYFLLSYFGMYRSMRTRSYASILFSLTTVQVFGALVLGSTIYFIDQRGFSRGLVG